MLSPIAPRPAVAAVLAMASLLLAGCTSPLLPNGSGCEGFQVPAAAAGDVARYRAEGEGGLAFTTGPGSPVTWSRAEPDAEDDVLVLPAGSELAVAIGARPVERLSADGAYRPAYQATWWAHRNGDARAIDIFDEWIGSSNAALVQVTVRQGMFRDGDYAHQIVPDRESRPGLLFGPLLWGRPLMHGSTGTVSYAHDLWAEAGEGALQHAVESVRRGPTGVCEAEVTFRFSYPVGGGVAFDYVVHTKWAEDTPLPVRYAETVALQGDSSTLNLQLDSYTPGGGPALPRFEQVRFDATQLTMARPKDGFLPGGGDPFPTSFDEALRAVRSDAVASQWLRDHPDAALGRVVHVMGAPGSKVQDQWELQWIDPQGDKVETVATNQSRLPGGLLPEVTVSTRSATDANLAYPAFPDRVPRFDDLVALHARVYGKPIEVVNCTLYEGSCDFGTHNATHKPHVCESVCASGGILSGLWVDLRTGRVVQETSYDPTPMGTPVPRAGSGGERGQG